MHLSAVRSVRRSRPAPRGLERGARCLTAALVLAATAACSGADSATAPGGTPTDPGTPGTPGTPSTPGTTTPDPTTPGTTPPGTTPSTTPPSDTRAIARVLVGVQADPAVLYKTGDFVLRIIPLDGKGDPVLSDTLAISAGATAPSAQSLPVLTTKVQHPDARPLAATVLIDDSQSMTHSDSTNRRAAAAKLFWSEVLGEAAGNQVALTAFGRKATSPFSQTALLTNWTRDDASLTAGVAQLTSKGGTNLYGSTAEVAKWMVQTRNPSQYRHMMLILTDGRPSDSLTADAAIQTAVNTKVPVYTVGLGPASSASKHPDANAVARLQAIANATGGVYSAAESTAELTTTFQSVGKLITEGAMLLQVRMSPAPAPGTRIAGAVSVGNSFGSASGDWAFTPQ